MGARFAIAVARLLAYVPTPQATKPAAPTEKAEVAFVTSSYLITTALRMPTETVPT